MIHEFGIDKLSLDNLAEPEPGPNEALIRFRAASLNYRDVMVVSGTYNPRMRLPAIPASDGAGEVVSIGSGVSKWQVGDRVMPIFAQRWYDGPSSEEKRRTSLGAGSQWQGVLREFGAFHEDSLVRVPDHLSFEEATTLPCAALTAWNALNVSGRIRSGETVVTLGTGGVSIFALQFAKMAGARVIATTGSEEKMTKLRELGADEIINYKADPDWDKAVIRSTGGLGADHVVEVGGSGTLGKSINATRIAGHIALIGALTGGTTFDPVGVFMKAIRLQGIFVGSRTMFEVMNAAIAVNKMFPVVDRVFDFGSIPDALAYMKGGEHFGKIVVRIAD